MTPAVQASLCAARDGYKMVNLERYESGVGSLLHLARCVRPDIPAFVGVLAAYRSSPTEAHFAAMLDIHRCHPVHWQHG
jgi:hypothetical protein